MDCFYIITNKLKDKDYAITSQIEQYIQSSGKKCFLSEKDSEGPVSYTHLDVYKRQGRNRTFGRRFGRI